jgi:hypothetical protein
MNAQITYNTTDNEDRGRVLPYNWAKRNGLPYRFLNKTSFQYDLTHLPQNELNLTTDVTADGDIESKFTIGFEVEKNSFHRDAVKEYSLFSHFETDGSCGVEAVSNVLPLIGKSVWRNKVLNMFSEAKNIIEDEFSPSDINCGGHINLAVKGMSGGELADAMRPYSGIIYALYRFRLKRSWCESNIFMDVDSDNWEGGRGSSKYQVCRITHQLIEFRLPSRVSSVSDLNLRYRLMYEIVNYAVNKPNGTHRGLLSKLKPILMMMYNNDTDKVAEVMELSKEFRKMLMTRKINHAVQPYIDKFGRLSHLYTRSLKADMLR